MSFVTSGTYQRTVSTSVAQDWVADTEVEVPEVATNIKSSATSDALFSWVRYLGYVWRSDGDYAYEWMLIRCGTGEATQDLSDASVVEALQKEGRLFARGFFANASTASGGRPTKIAFEVYNVNLPIDNELRLVVRPLVGATDTIQYYSVLEWRQVGV